MKKMDKILLSVAILIVIFIITMIVIFCVKDSVPDTLITCTLGGGVVELFFTTIIKVTNIRNKEDYSDEE